MLVGKLPVLVLVVGARDGGGGELGRARRADATDILRQMVKMTATFIECSDDFLLCLVDLVGGAVDE